MRNLLVMMFFVAALSVSCTKNEVDVAQPLMTVGVQVIQTTLKSAGEYDRGTAPVYVAGLNFTVKNTTYDVAAVEKTFDFVTYGTVGGQTMKIDGITPSNNEFTCVSIAENEAKNTEYELQRIPESEIVDNDYMHAHGGQITEPADNFHDRAYHYSNFLDVKHPLFMTFSETKDYFLVLDNKPNLFFDLKADYYRLNLILECADNYFAEMSIYDSNYNLISQPSIKASGDIASCVVLNSEDIKEGNMINVYIAIMDANGEYIGASFKENINIDNGTKATRVFRYNGDDLEVCAITAVYQPIVEDNSGEDI